VRIANYRTNWLTRAQGLMFDAHFVIEQATRFRAGWLFQFNGTGGVWRRAAIEAAGGWRAIRSVRISILPFAPKSPDGTEFLRWSRPCPVSFPKSFALAGATKTLVERLCAGARKLSRGLDGQMAGFGESCRRVS